MSYNYEWPMASNTTDAVVFGLDLTDKVLKVLLIERGTPTEPFYQCWALPGGFVNVNTDLTLDAALLRELREETGIVPEYYEQLATFGDMGRDPRGRVISTAYLMLVRPSVHPAVAGDDAAKVAWFPITHLPKLAFDHDQVIEKAIQRLKSKVRWQPVGIELLPEEFTLPDLQRVYEAILGYKLEKSHFRRKALALGVLKDTGRKAKVGAGKRGPGGALYKFDRKKYLSLVQRGVDFEV